MLQGDYTPSELRKARQNIPTDTDEYTDCRDVLARAAARSVSGGGNNGGGRRQPAEAAVAPEAGAGGGGGGDGQLLTPSTDADHEALADALRGQAEPRDIGGRRSSPAPRGWRGAVRNGLPTPLVPLILLGVAVLAAGGQATRRYVLRHR